MRLPAKAGLHEDIIRASIELGSELGEEGMTMRAIASRLGVSATALYSHFENKSSILREIRLHGARLLQTHLVDAMHAADRRERLREMSQAYIAFARTNPWLYKLIFHGEEIDWSSMLADEYDEAMRPLQSAFATLSEGVAAGVFRSDLDVREAVFLTWASLHGLASLILHGRISDTHPAFPVPDVPAFVDSFIENLVRAFAAEAA